MLNYVVAVYVLLRSATSLHNQLHSISRLNSRLPVKVGSDDCFSRFRANSISSHFMSSYMKRRFGWIITLRRRARTIRYDRGRERDFRRMTSAIQILAERLTPTRQWTRVFSF